MYGFKNTLRKLWEEEIIIKKLDQPRSYTARINDKIVKRSQIHIRTG